MLLKENKIDHPFKGKISIEELSEIEALLVLSSFPHLGSIKIKFLVQHFGSALQALQATSLEISALSGFSYKIAVMWDNWTSTPSWQRNLEIIEKYQISLLPYTSPTYPKRLLELPDAPVLLYINGQLQPEDEKSIAIVGTRQASIYGLEMARRFAADLAAMGFTIVSGLARGIDTAAHQGALETGRTVAVIGSGLADIYPAENRALAQRLSQKGALISEFPMETPPDRQNFPQRNRIVSGMTLGTLLIQAPIKSGAMLTMERGYHQGRKLFVLPGRVEDNCGGNLDLIKQGKGILVENASEIAGHLNMYPVKMPVPVYDRKMIPLDKQEEKMLTCLPNDELSIEEIFTYVNMPSSALNAMLMKLVLKGYLKEFPGKVYKKIGAP